MGRIKVRRLPSQTYELLLYITNRHVNAQVVDRMAGRVIVGVHTNEPELREKICGPDAHPGNYQTSSVNAARIVGETVASRANSIGLTALQWARPGKYHGKIKAFIDAVRDGGIQTLKAYPPGTLPGPDHQRQKLADIVRISSEPESEQKVESH